MTGFLGRLAAGLHAATSPDLQAVQFGSSESIGGSGSWIMRALGGGKTSAGIPVNEVSALTYPAVYGAVRILSGIIAQLPIGIFRNTPEGMVAVTDHPLSWKLSKRPNPNMSSFTARSMQQSGALLWGNGCAEIERNGRGQATGIWPLMADRTNLQIVDQRLIYRTRINGQSITLDPDDVLHVKSLGTDGLWGLSPIGQAREAISMGLAMEKFGGKFFANDAKSGGFLLHPGKLGDAGKKNLADSVQDQGGNENAHRVKVLEEGVKFVQTTIPPEDAQFLASRAMQIEEVSRIFGVPLVLLSSHEKTSSWGAGVEQLMIAFAQFTIAEWLKQWEDEYDYKLFTDDEIAQGYCVRHNLNALLRGDMTARAAFYQSGIANKWLVPNEVRAWENLNKVPWGDEPVTVAGAATEPVKSEGLHE
ncbi:phage portal protein [Lichenihabitans psoromatis]|uniref:phage portal protein n=1 Tax=Lichenihabitans psoromatis TaxID=2528642 RepID=UPI0010385A41|nr:phage portal protein [Lichenihabitans psoromatis]